VAAACGDKKMFSAVSVSSNEVGVIENPTVSEFSKVSFSINLAVFLASGPAHGRDIAIVTQDPGLPFPI